MCEYKSAPGFEVCSEAEEDLPSCGAGMTFAIAINIPKP